MGRILVGVSSWADTELVRSGYYPDGTTTPEKRLRYHASQFPIAEIDSSYHFFPTRRNLSLWLENTPEGFVFDVKAFSLLTQHPTPLTSLPRTIREKYGTEIQARGNLYPHHLPGPAIEEIWEIFNRTVEAFDTAGKLGAILFQFPPWFHPEPRNYEYIAKCRERLTDYRVAVEFRAANWLEAHKDETLDFLRQHRITLVCVDEPQGFKSSVPPVAEVTAPLAIVRFHGRNKENWERRGAKPIDKFNYLYNEEELSEWVPKIARMAKKAGEVHVIFKNKYADFPVRNAALMKRLLGLT